MKMKRTSEGVWGTEPPVDSVKTFSELIDENFYPGSKINGKLDLNDYVWRGEPESDTPLTSSFDRKIKGSNRKGQNRFGLLKKHRRAFLYAARGRTDMLGMSIAELKHYVSSRTLNDKHFWAFGQHYGLATPLLDWTVSPYAALFFACEKKHNDHPETEDGEDARYRYVYGLKFKEARELSRKLDGYKNVRDDYEEKKKKWEKNPIMSARPTEPSSAIEFFSPMSSEFGRLVTQRGIFTITEDGGDIKGWVENLCRSFGEHDYPILIEIKIKVSDEKRIELLRWLNTMNINHHTLYPDIEGAAKFCNLGLELDHGYADAVVP